MERDFSLEKVLLLAVYVAAQGDLDQLAAIVCRYTTILPQDIFLRILLTYLPETVEPQACTEFVKNFLDNQLQIQDWAELDTSLVDTLSDDTARKKVKRLHLLPLYTESTPDELRNDAISSFIFHRAHRLNSEGGVVIQLVATIEPFLGHSIALRNWTVCAVQPFVRRHCKCLNDATPKYTLSEFENMPDLAAVAYLLSDTISGNETSICSDLRSLIVPWLQNERRWKSLPDIDGNIKIESPGWEQVLHTILSWAATSWTKIAGVLSQWDGPGETRVQGNTGSGFTQEQSNYLTRRYASAAISCVYSVPDFTLEALGTSYQVCRATRLRLDPMDSLPTIDSIMSNFSLLPEPEITLRVDAKLATYMRHDLLNSSNPLTSSTSESLILATVLTISAYISTSFGVPWSVRSTGDLLFLQDIHDQKGELSKLLRGVEARAPRDDDSYWKRAIDAILWLYSWNNGKNRSKRGRGPLGAIPSEYLESEILKVLLSNSRYSLSRALYQNDGTMSLSKEALRDVVYNCALDAFDNASNPNRTRGGLRRCDEIIHAFPEHLDVASPPVRRIEALLKASHVLSEYRLVLKQGEPFNPLLLRIHPDPINIIEKVLKQNPKAYTRLQEFLELGSNMVYAGLTLSMPSSRRGTTIPSTEAGLFVAEKRIVAMCIETALDEDDFETAYSFVVSWLGNSMTTSASSRQPQIEDAWSWVAALKSGQYIRTERSQQPTHLGTSSGNLDIRHLEQRIECLAMALRAAPLTELQSILKSFRRCEEQLNSAIREEEAAEEAAVGNLNALPGSFEARAALQQRADATTTTTTTRVSGGTAAGGGGKNAEAPMSLFDLSRATAKIAQRSFTGLSAIPAAVLSDAGEAAEGREPRTRKRDQLREAATGTLVSGVGWLIGANMSTGGAEDESSK